MLVFLNGEFVDDSRAAVSIWDAGLLYGYGAFEALRTFGGKVKMFDEHFARFEASAKALRIPLPQTAKQLANDVQKLVELRLAEEPGSDFRIRITLTAGTQDLRQDKPGTPTLFITAKALEQADPKPITLKSFNMIRQQPAIKTTAMLPAIFGQHDAHEHGRDEALLVDDAGLVHESSFSNVYAIKDGVLRYPSSGSLHGVTQALLLELTADLLPSEAVKLSLQDFYDADEVVSSGSVRGVVPIKQIDSHSFEAPGPLTIKIQKLYRDWSES